jgi:predicted DNA-binding protein
VEITNTKNVITNNKDVITENKDCYNDYVRIRLTSEAKQKLKTKAEKLEKNMSEFIREIIESDVITTNQMVKYQVQIKDLQGKLNFLNNFFKENVRYLAKNEGIKSFMIANRVKFNEIEEITKNE